MVKRFRPVYLLYLFGLIWLTGMAVALFRPDPIIDRVFEELSRESEYSVHKLYFVQRKFDQQGRLGEMYHCLREYKGHSKRKPKFSEDVAVGKWVELKSLHYVIRMEVSAGEAYIIEITEVDSQGEEINSSNSYAVNCDLVLLNS